MITLLAVAAIATLAFRLGLRIGGCYFFVSFHRSFLLSIPKDHEMAENILDMVQDEMPDVSQASFFSYAFYWAWFLIKPAKRLPVFVRY